MEKTEYTYYFIITFGSILMFSKQFSKDRNIYIWVVYNLLL